MEEPKSFCTICTKQCKFELIGFLLSLSLHHKNSKVYIICDSETKQYIENSSPKPLLDIKWYIELDKYSIYNRAEMENKNIPKIRFIYLAIGTVLLGSFAPMLFLLWNKELFAVKE